MNKLLLTSLLTLSISQLQSVDIPSKDDFRDREIPWTPADTDEILNSMRNTLSSVSYDDNGEFIDEMYRRIQAIDDYHDRKLLELDLIRTTR